MSGPELTALLQRWSAGDRRAAEEVVPLVYGELRRIAARQLRRERGCHTLQATALVHEVYLRLAAERRGFSFADRGRFFAFAAHLVRRVLVEHARTRNRDKRGAGRERLTLAEADGIGGGKAPDLVALDDALTALAAFDRRKAMVVELRFFGGLSREETAAQLGLSPVTVSREWRLAKAWLLQELDRARGGPGGA